MAQSAGRWHSQQDQKRGEEEREGEQDGTVSRINAPRPTDLWAGNNLLTCWGRNYRPASITEASPLSL